MAGLPSIDLTMHGRSIATGFVYTLFLFFTAYLLSLSIQYTDSDLWYHLAGGRYFFEEGRLYNPFVLSFLAEPREFINYFWGFQVLTFATWSALAEPGLILLKAAFFLGSGYFTAKILLQDRPVVEARFLHLFAIALVIGILCARGLALRPHLASYLFIPVFIYILSCRPKLCPLLPFLTVLWVNLHGVEYVVGALICGSYFLQRLIEFREDSSGRWQPLAWIAACLPAMMLNPNGVLVLLTPFAHDPDLSRFILELGPFELTASLDLESGISLNTMALLLLAFVGVSTFHCARDYRQHLAPLLIAAGGLILFFMARRFVWEWALLSTPLVAAGLNHWRGPAYNLPATATLVILLVLLPVTFWPFMRNGLQHYPLDVESLPYGTTEFIRRNQVHGDYAVEPSYAGYVEFELGSQVRIHMDMQFPPFHSMDIQEINTAMRSAAGFRAYVDKYDPDLIGVKKSLDHFPGHAARAAGYVPVFFDKRVVLYLNGKKHADLAEQYELKAINPFHESVIPLEQMDASIRELERMLTVVDSVDIKLTLAALLIEQGHADRAGVYLSELREVAPDDVSTIYYNARFQHLNDNCAAAVIDYESAISSSGGNNAMHGEAAECYFLLGEQRKAYRHFREAINPYKDPHPDPLAYFQFALSAVGVGETDEARQLLQMIERFAPDSELQPQISKMLQDLQDQP